MKPYVRPLGILCFLIASSPKCRSPRYFPWYPYKSKGNLSYGLKLLTGESVFIVLLKQLRWKIALELSYFSWRLCQVFLLYLNAFITEVFFPFICGVSCLLLQRLGRDSERWTHKLISPRKRVTTHNLPLPAVTFLWETAASRSSTWHCSSSTCWKASGFKLFSWVNWLLIRKLVKRLMAATKICHLTALPRSKGQDLKENMVLPCVLLWMRGHHFLVV